MIKLADILQGYFKVTSFDRAQYYEKYIRNVLPSTFKITCKDNVITIIIK